MKRVCVGILFSLAALSAFGCMSSQDWTERITEDAKRTVRERAPFDLGCDEPELVRLGDMVRLSDYHQRMTIGAKCENKRASYVVTCMTANWVTECTSEVNMATTN